MSRASGLDDYMETFEGLLLSTPAYFVRPDARVNAHLSFPPVLRTAPLEIMRWMSHGSVLPWIEQLAAQAAETDGLKAEIFLAREIIPTGTTLDTLLDEFHPATVVISSTVKWIFRRLIVLKDACRWKRTS